MGAGIISILSPRGATDLPFGNPRPQMQTPDKIPPRDCGPVSARASSSAEVARETRDDAGAREGASSRLRVPVARGAPSRSPSLLGTCILAMTTSHSRLKGTSPTSYSAEKRENQTLICSCRDVHFFYFARFILRGTR